MIRPFVIEDSRSLCDMLMAEGLKKDQMDFLDNETWVYEDEGIKGFYTFKIEYDIFPHLQHFCIRGDCRGGSVARALIRHFKDRIRVFRKAIINSPVSNEFVDKVIRRYFKIDKPYSVDNEHKFYWVNV